MGNGMLHEVADSAERANALDVSQSFIVRAPAGSGKTRLLIQRYLALLARVDEPEEIIAITFTRKAAGEMKTRVLDAFAAAGQRGEGDGDDEDTLRLARAALARDAERGWQILANTSRLRMQTIDSLNASITRQMPLLARFGAQPESVDDASTLYLSAARQLLAQINDASQLGDDVATLLAHLDNNRGVAEKLLSDVLRSRDHWLRSLRHMHEREILESSLVRVRTNAVAHVAALFPEAAKHETLALARFAGRNLSADGVDAGLCVFADAATFPDAGEAALPAWLALADLLLTKEGAWRKQVNKLQGFPTSSNAQEKARLGEQKNRMHALLQLLSAGGENIGSGDATALALQVLRSLPAAGYTASQWQILGAIVRLLPHGVAALWSVFAGNSQCDFTEISQAASRALGDDDSPTDLALALDYRISHLLVDEFQDTSFAQFELLQKLTRGWTQDDGRTLFLVGDPMQSIYRFREAEVSLFSRAWRSGLGGVSLKPLTLRVNFRSCAGVVEWVNGTFAALMPREEDAMAGSVPYAPSLAFAADDAGPGQRIQAVVVHPSVITKPLASGEAEEPDAPSTDSDEARRVVDIINLARHDEPEGIIAILVRNRGHLREILPALKANNIAFRAVDIDPLKGRPVVQDLFALTRAVTHLADRIAWLAVLRAPWCGLALSDLAALSGGLSPVDGSLRPDNRTVWELLNDTGRLDFMSTDGRARASDFRNAIAPALHSRRRLPLRETVENIWLALRGPATLARESDFDDVAMFLQLVDEETQAQASGGQLNDLDALENRIDGLFAGATDSNDSSAIPPVQIMTIHKAKGLEFDSVIVPGLHRAPRRDDNRLLVWMEQASAESGARELLLAPIRETGAEDEGDADSIYQYIQQQERLKQRQEMVRLLYVAATRSRRRLHLLGAIRVKDESAEGVTLSQPRADSLLATLWPALPPTFLNGLKGGLTVRSPVPETAAALPPGPMRLANVQSLPTMPAAVHLAGGAGGARGKPQIAPVDFEWAGEVARQVGSTVHVFLQLIAEEGVDKWSRERVNSARASILKELTGRGVPVDELPVAVARVIDALVNTLGDSRGRWTLLSRPEARTEWRLTGLDEGALVNIAIDRTFVDDHGVRWIVDYKTGTHEGADVDSFLDNERQRYTAQLETYAKILGSMSVTASAPRIRLGLYFPMLKGWREWEWKDSRAY